MRTWDAKIQTLLRVERVADLPVMKKTTFSCPSIFRRPASGISLAGRWTAPLLRRRGFTLVEMLVVIALLGIIVAIAIPNFGALNDSANVLGAAQTIATDLQLAKMRAISQSKRSRILFLSDTSYKFQYFDSAGSIWKDLSGETVRTFDTCTNPYFHEGVTITGPAGNEVVFQPWGSSSSTSIQVQNAHKRGTITVSNTGKISTEVIDL